MGFISSLSLSGELTLLFPLGTWEGERWRGVGTVHWEVYLEERSQLQDNALTQRLGSRWGAESIKALTFLPTVVDSRHGRSSRWMTGHPVLQGHTGSGRLQAAG